MGQLVLSVAGAIAGNAIAPGFGGFIGSAIGGAIGGALFGPQAIQQTQEGPRLTDLKITGTEYGQCIPWILGSPRIAGQIWWASDRRQITHTSTSTSGGGGKGGGGPPETVTTTTTYTYDCDLLIGLADNRINDVLRIWENGKLIWVRNGTSTRWDRLTVYDGRVTQLPDPTYEAAVGSANAVAYRGRAYVFIEGLHLGQSGQIQNLTFEVAQDGAVTWNPSDKAATLVLSNDDLTAVSSTGVTSGVRANIDGVSAGQWYWEVTIDVQSGSQQVGILTAGNLLNSSVGQSSNGFGYDGNAGHLAIYWTGGSRYIGMPAYGAGDVVGVALDCDAKTVSFYVNGVLAADHNGLTAFYYGNLFSTFDIFPAVSGDAGGQATGAFKTQDFAYTPPTGYLQLVKAAGDVPIETAMDTLLQRAGLAADQFDVSALDSITKPVRALAVSQMAPSRTTIEALMGAYYFEMTVSDKIFCYPRGGAPVDTIPYLDLGASEDGQFVEPLTLKQSTDIELSAQWAVTYANVNNDYQTDTQLSDRLVSAVSNTVRSVPLAMGFTPAEAKGIADTAALDALVSLVGTPISVLGDYAHLEPTDVITVVGGDGSTYRLRIVRKTDAYPLLTFECLIDDATVLIAEGITSADYTSSTEVAVNAGTLMELMDIPILRDLDDAPGFYAAAKGDDSPWPGGVIDSSPDDVTYTARATVSASAVFGTCSTTLGNWTGARVFDEINTVTVDVSPATLTTYTRDDLLADGTLNLMLIGTEIVQFRDATLVAPGVYTLSGLLRGCRGTEWAMTGHAASERCVLLRVAGLARVADTTAELGIAKYWKGVTAGAAVSSATAEVFSDNGVGLKPFSPFDLRASRDGSANITFTWQRRTRLAVRTTGALGISIPLGEDSEAYDVEIYDGSGYTTLKRTITATSTTADYSAADQTTDFGSTQAMVYARVYQRSAQVGQGYKLEAHA